MYRHFFCLVIKAFQLILLLFCVEKLEKVARPESNVEIREIWIM